MVAAATVLGTSLLAKLLDPGATLEGPAKETVVVVDTDAEATDLVAVDVEATGEAFNLTSDDVLDVLSETPAVEDVPFA